MESTLTSHVISPAVTLSSADSKVTAVLEDYAGNEAETVLR
ncbi:hypothetical protein [Streptomyces sp. SGAir0957]